MAELSHRALRELIEGFGGCDEYFTEMISAPALIDGGPFEKWYVDNGPCPERLVYQVVGSNGRTLAKAVAILDRQECAGIDLNMGCSAPPIRKTGAGVSWMTSQDRAGEMVRAVRRATGKRLSVKLRLGFSEDFEYLLAFCRRLQDEGIDLITLHPRTAREKLKGRARWSHVGELRRLLSIPVAGNGDVASPEELARKALGPCDAVMVGRAAVRRPWIFARANSRPVHPDYRDTGIRFLELLAKWQPPEFHLSRAQRFFGFFCDNLKWGNYLKNLLNREQSLSGVLQVWRNHFDEGREEDGNR